MKYPSSRCCNSTSSQKSYYSSYCIHKIGLNSRVFYYLVPTRVGCGIWVLLLYKIQLQVLPGVIFSGWKWWELQPPGSPRTSTSLEWLRKQSCIFPFPGISCHSAATRAFIKWVLLNHFCLLTGLWFLYSSHFSISVGFFPSLTLIFWSLQHCFKTSQGQIKQTKPLLCYLVGSTASLGEDFPLQAWSTSVVTSPPPLIRSVVPLVSTTAPCWQAAAMPAVGFCSRGFLLLFLCFVMFCTQTSDSLIEFIHILCNCTSLNIHIFRSVPRNQLYALCTVTTDLAENCCPKFRYHA